MTQIDELQNELTTLIYKYGASSGMYSEIIDVFIGNAVMLSASILYDLDETDMTKNYIDRLVLEHVDHTKKLIREIEYG
jgi:hypothetical protein